VRRKNSQLVVDQGSNWSAAAFGSLGGTLARMRVTSPIGEACARRTIDSSTQIDVVCPRSGKKMHFTAPWPADFEDALKFLRLG